MAYGNANFEVDQRNAGNVVSNPAGGTFIIDRWTKAGNGTYQINANQQSVASAGSLVVPGTNFQISSKFLITTLTTAQASLGATDYLAFRQNVESINLRELINDVHSISLLVASSVAGLKFSVALVDSTNNHSLVKLCTIPTAGTWTLIQLPNIPIWTPSGTFPFTAPGSAGYNINIVLACGSTYMAPAADVWQNGLFYGAPGMSSFVGQAVNSFFQIGFIQHEPGAQCTTLIDLPFDSNLLACWRYFQKTYDFATKPGTVTQNGAAGNIIAASSQPRIAMPFRRTMAKAPTVLGYSPATGASANVRDVSAAADKAITAYLNVGEAGFNGCTITSPNAAVYAMEMHYTADTGW